MLLPTTLLLDVLGGAGAVWGCAEAFALRDACNNDQWRIVCTVVGALCLVRWLLQRCDRSANVQTEAVATFLLQVLGGAGGQPGWVAHAQQALQLA